TFLPLKSGRETVFPASSASLNAGALSPGWGPPEEVAGEDGFFLRVGMVGSGIGSEGFGRAAIVSWRSEVGEMLFLWNRHAGQEVIAMAAKGFPFALVHALLGLHLQRSGIDVAAIVFDAIVQVDSRSQTRFAHITDHLALLHSPARLYSRSVAVEMGVIGIVHAVMADLDGFAVPVHPFGILHLSVPGGEDFGAQ